MCWLLLAQELLHRLPCAVLVALQCGTVSVLLSKDQQLTRSISSKSQLDTDWEALWEITCVLPVLLRQQVTKRPRSICCPRNERFRFAFVESTAR